LAEWIYFFFLFHIASCQQVYFFTHHSQRPSLGSIQFFCLNFPRNQRVNLYQYWGESFLDRCLSKLYPTILPIIQHHGHCYLQIAYRAKKATKWAEIWTVVNSS
jgi:hypothetical protein